MATAKRARSRKSTGTKKAGARKSGSRKYGKAASKRVASAMRRRKRGTLRSSSGAKVPRQGGSRPRRKR